MIKISVNKIWGVLVFLLSVNVVAVEKQQEKILQQIEMSRSIKQVQVIQHIRDNLHLTKSQQKVFWPLYSQYSDEMKTLNDGLLKLIASYADNYRAEEMSDKKGLSLLEQSFKIELNRISIKRKYVHKFNKVLPANLVARFFHIDNKLEALIKYGLSKEIPLIPIKS